jgi:hypothetical protein
VIRWLRLHMPLDGRGWAPPDDARRRLFAVAASSVRRRLPAPVAGPVLAVARVGWLPVALVAAWRFARRRRTPLRPLFIDCLMAGAWPGEAYLWRELFGRRIELGGRALSLLLPRLG